MLKYPKSVVQWKIFFGNNTNFRIFNTKLPNFLMVILLNNNSSWVNLLHSAGSKESSNFNFKTIRFQNFQNFQDKPTQFSGRKQRFKHAESTMSTMRSPTCKKFVRFSLSNKNFQFFFGYGFGLEIFIGRLRLVIYS